MENVLARGKSDQILKEIGYDKFNLRERPNLRCAIHGLKCLQRMLPAGEPLLFCC
jgi:hypothetical protein